MSVSSWQPGLAECERELLALTMVTATLDTPTIIPRCQSSALWGGHPTLSSFLHTPNLPDPGVFPKGQGQVSALQSEGLTWTRARGADGPGARAAAPGPFSLGVCGGPMTCLVSGLGVTSAGLGVFVFTSPSGQFAGGPTAS